MASDRDSTNPLIDIAAVVVSPALVMLMVGSLVFFLIEVLYQGQYSGRLLWTMFFFVFGAVLIARLSIQFGRTHAALYAAGLGGACFVALMTFVEYPAGPMKTLGPVVNLLLMALVWWSADKLTWDCTHFDDERKASGRGVLAAAGLSENDGHDEPDDDEGDKKKPKKRAEGFAGWVDRFEAYREAQRKKAHTPGVWVLYFSLAALPLFALGQSLISPDDAETRRATFYQMAIYVGSGLGLLVTTTLFGLKRYLEQRNARIPAVMTAGWLGLGLGLIVLFLAVGALLPRPHSETPWFGMKRGGQSQRDASRYAVLRDKSAGKGEGAEGQKTEAGKGKNSAKGGEQKGGNGGEKGSGGGKGNSQGGQKSDKGSQGKGQQGGQKNNDSGNKSEQSKGQQGDQKQRNDSRDGSRSSDQKRSDAKSGEQSRDADENRSGSARGSSGTNRLSQMMQSIGSFVKWVVWILVAAAVIVGGVVFVLKWLAPFTNWAQGLLDWLRGLFARKKSARERDEEEDAAPAGPTRPPPFAAFSNPFTDRTASRRDPAELVEYTFAAFDSWAWDRGRGRQPGETPLEFAIRVGNEFEDVDEPAFRVANLYVRVLYSRSALPADARRTLEALWDQLESAPIAVS
jgi:hypothetical protein